MPFTVRRGYMGIYDERGRFAAESEWKSIEFDFDGGAALAQFSPTELAGERPAAIVGVEVEIRVTPRQSLRLRSPER